MLSDSVAIFVVVTASAFFLGRWQRDHAFLLVMLGYAVALSIVTILSLQSSVLSGPGGTPYLAGSDGEGYFFQARLLAQEGVLNYQSLIRSNYLGYQIFLAMLFSVFGSSLVVGLIANDIVLLLSICCLYRATQVMTGSQRAAMLACTACMLTTANVFYALVLLKEPVLGLAFALVLLAVAKIVCETRISLRSIIYLVLALAVIVTMRATVLLFIFILFAFVAKLVVRQRVHVFVVLVAMVVLAAPLAQYFTIYNLDSEFFTQEITRNTVIVSRFEQGDLDISGIAGRVGDLFIRLPFAVKVGLFPIPTMMQVLLPFDFWSSQFIDDHFSVFLLRNLNILWLLFVAPWVFFALLNVRRIEVPLMARLFLAGVSYYVAVAVVYSGLVPRYGTPTLIFLYPAVGYWWARAQLEPAVRARVLRFFVSYHAIFCLAGLGFIAIQIMRMR